MQLHGYCHTLGCLAITTTLAIDSLQNTMVLTAPLYLTLLPQCQLQMYWFLPAVKFQVTHTVGDNLV